MCARTLNLEGRLLLWLAGWFCLPLHAQNSFPNFPAPVWVQPAVDAPRLQYHTFASTAAKSRVSYQIYTPTSYDTQPDQRFPVLYWLHGSGGGLAGVAQLARHFDAAIRAGKIPPLLVVFPNGLPNGMWCDSKGGRTPVETIFMRELIPHIDATFRTLAQREGRILEGFSMGGYGAARLGFKYPAMFGAVSMLAGGPLHPEFETRRVGPPGRDRLLQQVYGGDLEYFKAQSPWRLAAQNVKALDGATPRRIVIGERDETLDFNRDFHEHLRKLGIPHSFTVLPGVGHDPEAVLKAMGDANWEFYRRALSQQAGAESWPPMPADVAEQAHPPTATAPTTPRIADFALTGERWTCTADGQPLSGILLKPEGRGPFPAVVLSHGLGGNAQTMALAKGREMVQWGLVCIATDYTHAAKAGGGRGRLAEVDFTQAGARPENIRRALACVEILRQRQDVDPRRIAAYGHSMGAFVTIALAAVASNQLAAAAITAGGLAGDEYRVAAAPGANLAAQVRVPFLILHGARDTTVTPGSSARLKQVLDANRVPNARQVFDGVGHDLPNARAADVNRLLREWFTTHGVLTAPTNLPAAH